MQSRVLAVILAVVLALVATAAMIVYVNGADRRALSNQQPVYVLRATKPIPASTSGEEALNGERVERVPVPRGNLVQGVMRSFDQLKGRYAEVDIVPGELLLLSRWVGAEDVGGRRLLQIPPDHQAVSIGVDLVRQVAGFVTPGDKVSLVLTHPKPGGGGGDETQFLLQNVQVLAVGATALTRSSQASGGRVSQGKGSQTLTAVTLAVDKKYVPNVVHAAVDGDIYLTLMPPDAVPAASKRGVDDSNVIPKNQGQ
jgi:pilus assembly protein CpaB